jgi:isopenicillin N synthase-like dioxygenase
MSSENFASLIGEGGPNDLVRKFRIGPTASSNNANDVDDPSSHRASSLHQPNVWPTANSWDDGRASKFKSSIEEYFVRTCHAADCILRAICDGTIDDDDDDDDDRKCGSNLLESMKVLSESCRNSRRDDDKRDDKKHTSILTLLGYQPGSRHKRGSRGYMRPLISAHTDVGVITLLHFDGGKCATLERAVEASGSTDRGKIEWMDVELPPSSRDDDPVFVVNVGDCLSDLSGGSLRSTLHRVMPRPRPNNDPSSFDEEAAAPRTCLALFVGLEPTASLTLPSGEVLSYEEWRRRRIARATDVMKKSNAPNEMNHG